MNIYIDIETLPTENAEVIAEIQNTIGAPGNYKKQETIDKWMSENFDKLAKDAVAKTALSGTFGQILCIGFAIDDEPVSVLYREDEYVTEESMLDYFFTILKTELGDRPYREVTFVGHNIGGFDLRFIQQRCVVNNVRPTVSIPYDKTPFSGTYYDTMYEWAGLRERISQDNLCRALGLPTKQGMTGADVWDYWKDGKHDEIKAYCKDDVETVRKIYNKLNFKGE